MPLSGSGAESCWGKAVTNPQLNWYAVCWNRTDFKLEPAMREMGQIESKRTRTMPKNIARRMGKWLFPNLARDQRKQRLSVITLVFWTSLFGDGALVVWMLTSGHRLF